MIYVQITNIAQIRTAFALAPALMIRYLNEAIQKSIFLIEGQSMIRTPVRTGRLRASHTTQFSSLKGSVGPTAFYAPFVHNGTRYMKARPFLYGAVQQENPTVQKFFTDAVQKTLNDIGRRT